MFIIKWIVTRVVPEEVSSLWLSVCGQCHDLFERAAVCFCPFAGVVIKERRLFLWIFFFVSVQCECKTGAVANLSPWGIRIPLFFGSNALLICFVIRLLLNWQTLYEELSEAVQVIFKHGNVPALQLVSVWQLKYPFVRYQYIFVLFCTLYFTLPTPVLYFKLLWESFIRKNSCWCHTCMQDRSY